MVATIALLLFLLTCYAFICNIVCMRYSLRKIDEIADEEQKKIDAGEGFDDHCFDGLDNCPYHIRLWRIMTFRSLLPKQ